VTTPKELSLDGVQALEIGNRVILCGTDAEGRQRILECTVAGKPGRKLLTYRDHGQLRRFPLTEYPGKHYRRAGT
jgi:hypothetical protein